MGAAPSPDGLVLSDPASSCLGYVAVALRSTACGRSYICRALNYNLFNESCNNFPHFFFSPIRLEILCIFNIHINAYIIIILLDTRVCALYTYSYAYSRKMICVVLYVPGTGMVFTAVITPNTSGYCCFLLRLLLMLVMVLCIGAALC